METKRNRIAICVIGLAFAWYACKPPLNSGDPNQKRLFYYGTAERVPLTIVPNQLIVKMQTAKDTVQGRSFLSSYGEVTRLQDNIFSVVLREKTAVANTMTSLRANTNTKSVNFAYRTADGQPMGITDDICLAFKDDVSANRKAELLQSFNATEITAANAWEKLVTIISVDKNKNALTVANAIYESGLVKFAHPNFIINVQPHAFFPVDPFFERQFYLHNTGQEIADGHMGTSDADIDAPEAWDITRGNNAITIAVLDEGVELTNQDLPAARLTVLPGSNFAGGSPDNPDAVGNGAHGTACAGIIAAEHNNGEGVSGIAPLCRIMPVRIPFGFVAATTYANALNFAWMNGADVLSNSWGYNSSADIPVITTAINNAITMGRGGVGSVVVFATGNTANHVGGNTGFVAFPASAPVPDMLVVGATDRYDLQANYSPDGALVDVVAPSHRAYTSQIAGECFEVWSTDIAGTDGYNASGNPCSGGFATLPSAGTNFNNYTARMGGTSAACPQVAAAAALLLSVNPTLTPANVHAIITGTADKVGGYTYTAGRSIETGFGRLNLFNMLSASLWSQDFPDDPGTEPNSVSVRMYKTEDIWVRKTADGSTVHENPEYRAPATGLPNSVYVKIRNAGNVAGTGTVKLYWAKASSGLSWPAPWDGSVTSPALMGGFINSMPVSVPARSETVLRFDWFPPNPADYSVFGADQFHFCLLSRLETTSTPPFGMAIVETSDLRENVRNNNNIVWKNISVQDEVMEASSSSGVFVSNYTTRRENTRIVLNLEKVENDSLLLLRYGKLSITLPEKLYDKWRQSGGKADGFRQEGNTFYVVSNRASFGDFILEPNEIHAIRVQYELNRRPNKEQKGITLGFDLEQYVVSNGTVRLRGGEHFQYIAPRMK